MTRPYCAGLFGSRLSWTALLVLSVYTGACGPRAAVSFDGCGFPAGCGDLRELHQRRRARERQRQAAAASAKNEVASSWVVEGDARPRYLSFIRERQELLAAAHRKDEERRELAVLQQLGEWVNQQDEAVLRQRMPIEVYVDMKLALEQQERAAAQRQAASDAKLEEFFDWAELHWAEAAQERVHLAAPRHLLTEHPLRTQSLDALTGAVLDWALTHTQDEDFPRKNPTEVALYLLARRSALATAIELGRIAPPHLDYTPPPDTSIPPEELAVELLGGMVPGIGELTDAGGLVLGYSVTGRKLDANERLLCGVAVLLPFVSGQVLSGAEKVERAALVTGRSIEEVRVLQRVATHLRPEEATQVNGLMRQLSHGGKLAEEDVAFLRRVATGLEKPLAEAADALRRGGKVPLVGSRLGEAGIRLEPGTAEHMAAAWVDYQFRHPDTYSRFRFAIEGDWRKKYELILKNKEAGGEFEQFVLKARGQEKNRALMLPPPGTDAVGFIPDGVLGSATPGELVWSQPYRFVEAKGRKELALTGNLKEMLDYIDKYGGSVELWVRSPKHSSGATRLTEPLLQRLNRLTREGKAAVRVFPP